MTTTTINAGGVPSYSSLSQFPVSAEDGGLAVARDTDSLYEFDGPTLTWKLIGPSGGGGSGTVTSVALVAPAEFVVSGSPITGAGTLTLTKATEAANIVYAGPTSGSAAQPTFRALVAADIPSLSSVYVTQSEVAQPSGVASLDSSGRVPLAQMPTSTMEYLGLWNPIVNTPHLQDGTGTLASFYWVDAQNSGTISGLNNFSMTNFQVGDLVMYNGSQWQLTTPYAGVTAVNGQQGAVFVNAINQLTGDVTTSAASGSQSEVATLATVNSNVGSFGSATAVSAVTVNAKGLVTAAASTSIQIAESQVTNLVTDLAAKAAHVIPTTNQIVYVSSLAGSNVTGDGSYDKPWATVAFAMTQITDSSSTKPYTISLLAARQVETTDVLWKPYVFIVGGMQRGSYIRINGGSFKPDASMSANSWIGFSDIYIGGGTAINFNMQAIGGNNLEFIIENCTVSGAITINGRNAGGGDFLEMYNCLTLGTITLDSVNFQIQSTEMGAPFIVTNTQAASATGTLDSTAIDVSITTAQSMFLNDVSYPGGSTITTTAAVTLDSYRGLPPTTQQTLFAGTTLTYRDNATIVPFTPTTPGNWSSVPVNVQQALDTLATTGTGTVTSVALADASTTPIYTVSGSPVTSAGTLSLTLNTKSANTVFSGPSSGSAAQPAFRSLVAADIPSLSATYVTQSEVGATSGVASLDGSGKVPLSQLPSTLLEYKGQWNPNTNTPTLTDLTGVSGYTYIVSATAAGPIIGLASPTMVNFQVGNLVIYNGAQWEQAASATGVTSVNGSVGAVTVNAISQLTGDAAAGPASGSASAALTLATVNSNVGSFTNASITVNAKGLITAASSGSGTPVLTAGSVAFSDGTTLTQDNTNFFYDSTNHSLSIGPGPHPATSADLAITSQVSDTKVGLSVFSTSTNNAVQINNQSGFSLAAEVASNTNSPSINFERARGTLASKTQALAGDVLGSFVFNGYTGSADGAFAAAFGAVATENQASGHAGAELVFQTTPNGSSTLAPRLIINQDGTIQIPGLTASRAIVTDGSSDLAVSATTSTEIGYVSGVTSAIQTQLNAKQAISTWATYTPTIAGFGTVTNSKATYKQIGDSLHVKVFFTTGTVAASLASITLPGGFTLSTDTTNKVPLSNTTSASGLRVGTYSGNSVSGSNFGTWTGAVITAPATDTGKVYLGLSITDRGNLLIPQNGNVVADSAIDFSLEFEVILT